MDFLLSSALLKYEILFLLLNLAYIVFHMMYETTSFIIRIRNIIMPSKINIADSIKEMAKEEEDTAWTEENLNKTENNSVNNEWENGTKNILKSKKKKT